MEAGKEVRRLTYTVILARDDRGRCGGDLRDVSWQF